MADEEDKTTVDTAGDKEASSEEKETKKKGGSKLILFGGIGLGTVVLGVALALFVIKPMMSESTGENDGDESTQVEASDHDKDEPKKTEHKKPKKKKKKKDHEAESLMYAISNIVINPAGTGGSRFLSVSFGFELESKELEEEFTSKEPIIRDALITILSSKTVAQLTDTKQKEIVRYQIKKRVSQLIDTDELAGVYFTDFVLQ
ncbi:MAG: flagellar basal body-associated protein FliL [Candidatus Zixiibacteriota bacterium]